MKYQKLRQTFYIFYVRAEKMGLVRHVTTWVLLLQMVSVFASADPATILAFDTIRNDTMNAPTVKTGTIPAWLKGRSH